MLVRSALDIIFPASKYFVCNIFFSADTSRTLRVWCDGSYPAGNLSNVCLWERNDSDTTQRWTLANSGGHYLLKPVVNSSKALDLYTGSGNGSNYNAQLYTPSNTSWLSFEPAANYKIHIKLESNSSKYLTANQNSSGTRTGIKTNAPGNVYFWGDKLSDGSQEWIVREVSAGQSGGDTPRGKFFYPTLSTSVSQKYENGDSGHNGIDIAGTTGDPIYAFTEGYVSKVSEDNYRQTNPKEGYCVRIHHANPLNNGYSQIRTEYLHMRSRALVNEGDWVRAGQCIGYMGSTGNSTGPHLHFTVRGSNTEFPLNASSNGPNAYYKGTCLDPNLYFALI